MKRIINIASVILGICLVVLGLWISWTGYAVSPKVAGITVVLIGFYFIEIDFAADWDGKYK
ncbi:MAG: hypothetical protein UGF45_13305 [Massilioclostridium sp.]|nr:hypothetical protein [Massilioclostridium sp.]